MRIRSATAQDRSAIAAVHAASWKTAYKGMLPDDYLRDQVTVDLEARWNGVEIRNDDVVLVSEEDGVVGFIAVWCRPDPFIDNLHVLPAQRSKGTGRNLMRAAAVQLLQQGESTAYLWVYANNHIAIRFYERLGGERMETAVKADFGHDVLNVKIVWSDLSMLATPDQGRS